MQSATQTPNPNPNPIYDPLADAKQRIRHLLDIDKQARSQPLPTAPDLSLSDFIKQAWPILEPHTTLIWDWYLDAITTHLQAVIDQQIRNLIINMPPRFGKSTTVAVAWPTHVWTYRPDLKFLFSSYGSDLSERDSIKCRRLINSNWYQSRYHGIFHILKDKDTKIKFENNHGGYRIATSIGGVVTGEGGDILVCDDPVKAQDAESPTQRNFANMWWSETMSSRLNDLRRGSKVIIMQRLHEEDLTGYVLAEEKGYTQLTLPMEYEAPRHTNGVTLPQPTTSIGWSDPRTTEGALLCPERAGPDEVLQLKRETTAYSWAGQYQQRPAPRGGGRFKRAWFQIVSPSEVPKHLLRVRGWDRAATPNGGAYTAGVRIGWHRIPPNTSPQYPNGFSLFYIEHVTRGQWSTDEREQQLRATAHADGRSIVQVLEREPGSAGIDSTAASVRSLPGYVVRVVRVTGSKDTRADPFEVQAAAGAIKLVSDAALPLAEQWNAAYLQELTTFPTGRYRDQVDATTVGFNELTRLSAPGHPVAGPPLPRFSPR